MWWLIDQAKSHFNAKLERHLIPGGCAQSSDPGLEDTHEELVGVFPHNCKVDTRQEYGTMDDQTNDNCYHVHSQLPGHYLQIFYGDDLSTDEAGDAEGWIPIIWLRRESIHVKCTEVWCFSLKSKHLPHDHDNQLHYNLIENVEEFNHKPGSFSHLAHTNTKGDEESNNSYNISMATIKMWKKESTCLYCIAKVMPIPNTFIPLLYCRDFLSMKIGGGLVALERNSAVLLVSSKSGWTSTLFTTVWTCVFKHHTNLFTISRQFPNGRIKQHASYLLEASLNQVLWKEVSDKVKKGIKTGNLIVFGSLSQILLEFWITRVDEKHQDNPQYSRNDSGGHIINHGSGTQTTTWLCIQTRKTFVKKIIRLISFIVL